MRHVPLFAAFLLGLLVSATPAEAQKRDRYIITAEEIAENPEITNGYEAVQRLRPIFLRVVRSKRNEGVPGAVEGASAILYIDELRQPDLQDLRNIRVQDIWEIKYLQPSKAKVLYGSDHEQGAIMVTTIARKPEPPLRLARPL